jgi:hypothetical protein
MLPALVLLATLAAPPQDGATTRPNPKAAKARKGPSAYDTALLYFLAGDLPSAQGWARRGLEREKAKCEPLHRLLVEYAYLFGATELTPEQAAELVAIDRKISRDVRAKTTEKVLARFVTGPLEVAKARLAAGDERGARSLVEGALKVDPLSEEARALRAQLEGADAGR